VKYIVSQDGEPGIFYGRYLEYVETIRDSLPEHIYQFASSEKYFTLNSPHSLHDSWLNSVEIREFRNGERPFDPVVGITLKLLGQHHDRIIILDYEEVVQYIFEGSRDVEGQSGFRYGDTFHGDVFTHEVRLSEKGTLIHEIVYVTESFLLIECKNFTYKEEILDPSSGKHALEADPSTSSG